MGPVWAVGNLRSAGGDGDDLSLIDDLVGHGHDHGAEENSGSSNGSELHFVVVFGGGVSEKECIKQISLKIVAFLSKRVTENRCKSAELVATGGY